MGDTKVRERKRKRERDEEIRGEKGTYGWPEIERGNKTREDRKQMERSDWNMKKKVKEKGGEKKQ